MELGMIAAGAALKLFVMAAVGVIAAWTKVIDEKGTSVLSGVVNKITNPLKIFASYCMAYDAVKFRGLMTSAGLGFLFIGIGIILGCVFIREKGEEWRVERPCCALSNCGYMGIPLISALFGDEAVFYLTGVIMAFNLVTWTYGVIVISGKARMKDLLKLLTSPSILAIIAGLCVYTLRLNVPDAILSPLKSIAECNTPLCMLVAGSTIARAKLSETLTRKNTYVVVFLKLLLVPAVFALCCRFFVIPELVYMTVFTASACPSAAVIVTLCNSYERNPGHAAGLFAVTTLLSLVTIPFMIWLQGMLNTIW